MKGLGRPCRETLGGPRYRCFGHRGIPFYTPYSTRMKQTNHNSNNSNSRRPSHESLHTKSPNIHQTGQAGVIEIQPRGGQVRRLYGTQEVEATGTQVARAQGAARTRALREI